MIAAKYPGTVIVVTTLGPPGPVEPPPLLLLPLLPLLPLLLLLPPVLLLVVVVTPFTLIEMVDILTLPQLRHSIARAPAVTRSI